MDTLITPTYTLFCIKSPKGNPPYFCKKAFLGFSPEPFPGAIITAAPVTATAIITAAVITATAISGTPTKVKAFPFRKTFQKVNSSIFFIILFFLR